MGDSTTVLDAGIISEAKEIICDVLAHFHVCRCIHAWVELVHDWIKRAGRQDPVASSEPGGYSAVCLSVVCTIQRAEGSVIMC